MFLEILEIQHTVSKEMGAKLFTEEQIITGIIMEDSNPSTAAV